MNARCDRPRQAHVPVDEDAPTYRLADLPQLRRLAWHVPDEDVFLTAQEAFALYERQWRHIDPEALSAREATVIADLTRIVGKGIMLV